MTTIIDGRKISKEILDEIKKEINSLSFQPVFCDVLVGDNSISRQYVNMKKHTAEEIGIHFHEAFFPSNITTENLVKEIEVLNKIPNMCGIIVQLPLPENLDQDKILNAVDSRLDVDCLNTITSEKFYNGDLSLGFPAALACIFLLDSINLSLKDKKIVVLGQGKLVGKPVSALLHLRGLTPEIISSQTENKEEILKKADVIISGMGKGQYIKGNMIKNGVIIIDAGTSELNSGIVGDVDLESVKDVAGFVSPVPGGVGPMTIAMLFRNILKVAKTIK
ncbi:MAG: bifunctional 5,10-methylenetetrahydrofolate dehydrogenase/5,10-methenyltetrahydrofolate cyclohydrolase [Candidatus Nomurabacteria bacterium]|nr:bifunctional 5,10-methylenetetrahydrofolate dehydrogenase/5,10-methenyltetrahydrofolate cyclohydrolase [Candidatus Nomurabacteria bacterium]